MPCASGATDVRTAKIAAPTAFWVSSALEDDSVVMKGGQGCLLGRRFVDFKDHVVAEVLAVLLEEGFKARVGHHDGIGRGIQTR